MARGSGCFSRTPAGQKRIKLSFDVVLQPVFPKKRHIWNQKTSDIFFRSLGDLSNRCVLTQFFTWKIAEPSNSQLVSLTWIEIHASTAQAGLWHAFRRHPSLKDTLIFSLENEPLLYEPMGKVIKVSTTKRMKQVWDQTKKGTVQILKKEDVRWPMEGLTRLFVSREKEKNSLV